MGRNPYAAHLCAQDPAAWEAGFGSAAGWVRYLAPAEITPEQVCEAIRDSTGVPFPATAAALGLAPEPWVEGFLLGVYGHVRLGRMAGLTC